MSDEVDVVIVGAGLMGAACAYALAKRGRSVVVVEQFAPGHSLGSSHGSARIVRRAYRDELYTRLSGQAFELWRELERSSGVSLLRMLGGLDFGTRRGVAEIAAHLASAGVPHEVLPGAEAAGRWPGMRFSGDVVYHPEAGTLDCAAAVDVFVAAARQKGAEVRYRSAARSVTGSERGAVVTLSDHSVLRAGCAVVAAGAWVAPLIGTVVSLPALRVTQQQIFHFPRLDRSAPAWPSVIHEDVNAVYHLAGGRDGGTGDDRKVGVHDDGMPVSADGRSGSIDPASRTRVSDYVRDWLPGLDPTPRGEASCLYTITPTEDFILDRVGPIVVCSPCSGHGAKFAPLIGECVADLVTTGTDVPARFRLAAHTSGRSGTVSL